MELLNPSSVLLVLIVTFQSLSFAIKLDTNVGSNWYPAATATTARTTPLGSTHYNNAKFQTSSSFLQTAPVPWGGGRPNYSNHEDYYKYYYQVQQPIASSSEPPQNQNHYNHQYYEQQQQQAPNDYSSSDSGPEQRQEFSDPATFTNLLPFGNNGIIDGDINDDGSQGSSFLSSLPFVGSITSFTSGIGSALADMAAAIGLGGLGIAGSLIVAAIGVPLLIILILFPVAILVVSILGFPVLQLTLPPSDPFLGRRLKSSLIDTASKAREVLQSEKCVERLSCLLARKSRKLPYENWILEKMDNISHSWINRVSNSVKRGRAGEDCENFTCKSMTKLETFYDSVISVSRQKLT